jgi:hypothetical protein
MQQPLPLSSQSKPENRCPGYFLMKLEGIRVQPEKQGIFKPKSQLAATDQIKLYLSILFNEPGEQSRGSQIQFGLKGGELRLRLENGTMPSASRQLNGLFDLSGQKAKQSQQGTNNQGGVTLPTSEGNPGAKTSLDIQETLKKNDGYQFPVCRITSRGSEENPTWVFAGEKDKPVLKGLLKRVLLGTLYVTAKPCIVEATFCVSAEDIYITNTDKLLPQTISKKKKTVIDRAIARRLLKRKLKPYLSRQELRYE